MDLPDTARDSARGGDSLLSSDRIEETSFEQGLMATAATTAAPVFCASVVANDFVEQYYDVLRRTPEKVPDLFYRDSSRITRAEVGPDGETVVDSEISLSEFKRSVIMLQERSHDINTKIISVDAQYPRSTLFRAVFVRVEGIHYKEQPIDGRKFVQHFFLAPDSEHSGYVQEDNFSYVDEDSDEDEPDTSSLEIALLRMKTSDEPVTSLAPMSPVQNVEST